MATIVVVVGAATLIILCILFGIDTEEECSPHRETAPQKPQTPTDGEIRAMWQALRAHPDAVVARNTEPLPQEWSEG